MGNKEINASFYLTIFESEIAVHNPTNEYFLKDLAFQHFEDELPILGIEKSINRSSILNL